MKIVSRINGILKRAWDQFFIQIWFIWIFLIGIILSFGIPYLAWFIWPSSLNIDIYLRLTGFIFQFLFISILIWDLISISNYFREESILDSIINWFKSIHEVFTGRSYSVSIDPLKMKVRMGSPTIKISLGDENDDLLKRVELLERRLIMVEDQIEHKLGELRTQFRKLEDNIEDEKKDRKKEINKVRDFIEWISTRGLALEIVGLFWLVIGLILSIFPNEMTKYFAG